MHPTPQWKVCIVTASATPAEYKSIKNSLLYADHIYWVSLEVNFKLFDEFHTALTGVLGDRENSRGKNVHLVAPGGYTEFKEQLRAGGAQAVVTDHFNPQESLDHLVAFLKDFSKSGQLKDLRKSVRQTVSRVLNDSRVIVGETHHLGFSQSKTWNSYLGAHELMMSLSRLLLPDISDLPVEAIMELRTHLQDSLDPVRAELLKLTEDLRKIVSTAKSAEFVSVEADNLIATRVEPLVRDANRRANELLDRKWRKLMTGAAKAFGFAGAGFADPKLFAKAIQQTLETSALALNEVEEDRAQLTATSQFVLHAYRLAPRT
jgi:hypothetical protein